MQAHRLAESEDAVAKRLERIPCIEEGTATELGKMSKDRDRQSLRPGILLSSLVNQAAQIFSIFQTEGKGRHET